MQTFYYELYLNILLTIVPVILELDPSNKLFDKNLL